MAVTQPQPASLQSILRQGQAPAGLLKESPAALPALNTQLLQQIKSLDFSFVISDAQHPDMPIVYASDGFYHTTGYSPSEVIGRNCRFLQGPETERQKVMEIRDAIREDRCCQVCLLNYRKDGSTFLNQFFLSPIKSEAGIVMHYVGIQTDVSAAAEAGLLDTPGALSEQQAAVALGTAAGCSMCDMVMQKQEVQQQLERQQQQQQQARVSRRASIEGVPRVIEQEVTHAGRVMDAFQHCPEKCCCSLPSSLLQSLLRVQASFVLSDPRLPDCPIVHASPEFLAMTGYSREEVVGRNCRFLQGPGTDAQEVAKLREAMASSPPRAVTVTLLNYRKDGSAFWNALHIAPVRDAEGLLEYFIGVQLDVTQGPQGGEAQQQAGAAVDGGEALSAGTAAAEAAGAGVGAAPDKLQLKHKMAHMTATGAVRVACRGLSGSAGGLRRSFGDQGLPAHGYSRSLSSRPSGASGSSVGGSVGGSMAGSGSFSHAAAAAIAEVSAEGSADTGVKQ